MLPVSLDVVRIQCRKRCTCAAAAVRCDAVFACWSWVLHYRKGVVIFCVVCALDFLRFDAEDQDVSETMVGD